MKPVVRKLIESQLKIESSTSPKIYNEMVKGPNADPIIESWYWDKIPEYIIGRCPICLMPYKQAIDTYSLWLWHIRHNMNSVRYSAKGYKRCQHFVGVHTFLNLNEQKPRTSELEGSRLFSSEPEIPMITPTLLPDDIKAYAVLHSLPICRAWGGRFLPKYMLYMVTYYSTDQQTLEMRRLLEWTGGRKLTSLLEVGAPWGYANKRLGIYWEETEAQPHAWNLQHWVEKGQLFWLDLAHPDLPLANNRTEFPYGDIKGVHHGYKYQDGKYEVVSTKPTIEEFQRNL